MHCKLPRSTAALEQRRPARPHARACVIARPARPVGAMMATHALASQIADRTMPPRFARYFDAAPTARTAALSTSIRPAVRARSIAGLPLPSRRSVDSLIAVASAEIRAERQRLCQNRRLKRPDAALPSGPAPVRTTVQRPGEQSRTRRLVGVGDGQAHVGPGQVGAHVGDKRPNGDGPPRIGRNSPAPLHSQVVRAVSLRAVGERRRLAEREPGPQRAATRPERRRRRTARPPPMSNPTHGRELDRARKHARRSDGRADHLPRRRDFEIQIQRPERWFVGRDILHALDFGAHVRQLLNNSKTRIRRVPRRFVVNLATVRRRVHVRHDRRVSGISANRIESPLIETCMIRPFFAPTLDLSPASRSRARNGNKPVSSTITRS